MLDNRQVQANRTTRRRAVTYAVLLAIALLLLALSRSAPVVESRRALAFALTPLQSALTNGTRTFTAIFSTLAELQEVRGENRRLQEQVQGLEVEIRRYDAIRVENEQLTQLLRVRSSLAYETIAAQVIGRGVVENERIVTLDQGTDRGISEGDVVIANGAALVGRVQEVGPNYSQVLLINDTRSFVIGLVESSRATGEVQGQLSRPLVMGNIPSTEEVRVGEAVVTAGIDLGNGVRSPFPKGLLVGEIVDVSQDPNAIVQTAFVAPAANLDKLEYVLVITDYEGGVPVDPRPAPSASGSPRATGSAPVRSPVSSGPAAPSPGGSPASPAPEVSLLPGEP